MKFILLLLPLVLLQDSKIKITFPEEAHAFGTEIELGEVAKVTGGSEALQASVKALGLGYVPAPGYSRVLRTDRVLATLHRKFPKLEVSLEGAGATRVYPMVTEVKGPEIIAAARAQLLKRYDGTKYSFQSRGGVSDVAIPQGSQKRQIKARLDSAPSRSGFINIPVDILVDGARFRTVWTGWDAVVYETRRVLNRDLRAGETIGAKDIEERLVPTGLNTPSALSPSLLPGSVAGHGLVAGSVVSPMDVVRPKAIGQRDLVRLKIMRGGVTASVLATAMASGAIGDRIRVQTIDKKLNFNATIKSKDTCVLILGN